MINVTHFEFALRTARRALRSRSHDHRLARRLGARWSGPLLRGCGLCEALARGSHVNVCAVTTGPSTSAQSHDGLAIFQAIVSVVQRAFTMAAGACRAGGASVHRPVHPGNLVRLPLRARVVRNWPRLVPARARRPDSRTAHAPPALLCTLAHTSPMTSCVLHRCLSPLRTRAEHFVSQRASTTKLSPSDGEQQVSTALRVSSCTRVRCTAPRALCTALH